MIKRFTAAIVIAALGIAMLAIGGLVHNQSSFAVNTVQSQLAEQGITFTPVSGLTPAQKTQSCLTANAGKPLITGAQAECYANYQIALDLLSVDHGKTYAQASYPERLLQVKIGTLAAENPHNPALPKLEAEAAQAEAPAATLFQGESLRGMLLTTYAFYHMGQLGNEAADTLFVLGALFVVAGIVLAVLRSRQPTPGS
jgi:hypothetical protein